jgi:hypothetical protein
LGTSAEDPEALARLVAPRIAPWLGKTALHADNRRLLESALLYVCYHRHVPQINDLVERQASQGGAPIAVSFSEELIAELVQSGFPEQRAARYFALFLFAIRPLVGRSCSRKHEPV